jgi:hypothetical protein
MRLMRVVASGHGSRTVQRELTAATSTALRSCSGQRRHCASPRTSAPRRCAAPSKVDPFDKAAARAEWRGKGLRKRGTSTTRTSSPGRGRRCQVPHRKRLLLRKWLQRRGVSSLSAAGGPSIATGRRRAPHSSQVLERPAPHLRRRTAACHLVHLRFVAEHRFERHVRRTLRVEWAGLDPRGRRCRVNGGPGAPILPRSTHSLRCLSG